LQGREGPLRKRDGRGGRTTCTRRRRGAPSGPCARKPRALARHSAARRCPRHLRSERGPSAPRARRRSDEDAAELPGPENGGPEGRTHARCHDRLWQHRGRGSRGSRGAGTAGSFQAMSAMRGRAHLARPSCASASSFGDRIPGVETSARRRGGVRGLAPGGRQRTSKAASPRRPCRGLCAAGEMARETAGPVERKRGVRGRCRRAAVTGFVVESVGRLVVKPRSAQSRQSLPGWGPGEHILRRVRCAHGTPTPERLTRALRGRGADALILAGPAGFSRRAGRSEVLRRGDNLRRLGRAVEPVEPMALDVADEFAADSGAGGTRATRSGPSGGEGRRNAEGDPGNSACSSRHPSTGAGGRLLGTPPEVGYAGPRSG